MAIRKAYCLFWIVNMCSIKCIWADATQSFQIKRDNLNRRLVSCVFSELTVHNHHECARECFNFGGKCKSMNFNRKNRKCELNAKTHDAVGDSEFEINADYIFSDISEWPKVMTDGCSNENCLDHQECRPIGKSSFQCVDKANCGEAPPIGNGSVSAPVTLDGATATYSCDFGFEINGEFTKRNCVEGIWSSETIICTLKAHVGCFVKGQTFAYEGTVDHTSSGVLCQRWDSQLPHYHYQESHEFPESTLSEAENYCRDPDLYYAPWCYTTTDERWEYCNVPEC